MQWLLGDRVSFPVSHLFKEWTEDADVERKGRRDVRSYPIPLLKPLDLIPSLDDFAGDVAAQDRRPLLDEDTVVLDLPIHGVDGGSEDAHDQVLGAGLGHVGCGDTERLVGAVEPGGLVTGLVVRHYVVLLLVSFFLLGQWGKGLMICGELFGIGE